MINSTLRNASKDFFFFQLGFSKCLFAQQACFCFCFFATEGRSTPQGTEVGRQAGPQGRGPLSPWGAPLASPTGESHTYHGRKMASEWYLSLVHCHHGNSDQGC